MTEIAALLLQHQRKWLADEAARLGVPLVVLKGAWSDAVLWGGRGERRISDIDILVTPAGAPALVAALQERGFRPQGTLSSFKRALTLMPPAGRFPVDLHVELLHEPWFHLRTADVMSRSRLYPAPEGEKIRSLETEDQLVYFAGHMASHVFEWDDRHARDMAAMLKRWPVDWRLVQERADAAGLGLALALSAERLRRLGALVPALAVERQRGITTRARLWRDVLSPLYRRRLPADGFWPGTRSNHLLHHLLFMPIISDNRRALPRYLLEHANLAWQKVSSRAPS